MDGLTISAAARRAGIGVETIRYYQRIGLIEEPVKPVSGYRKYTNEDLRQLQFIQRAKQLGFSLADIKTLLSFGEGSCDKSKELAASKLDDVRGKIKDLTTIADTLEQLIVSCENNRSTTSCPIIETISQNE